MNKGFFVIELLIILAILGILIAVTFPSYQSHRKGETSTRTLRSITEYCHEGVIYIKVDRGIAVKYGKDGKIQTCD